MQDISAHIMDIAQNSVRACASHIDISIEESLHKNIFAFTIKDNGCGMSPDIVSKVTDPFYTNRTVRKVGLGIPLLKQNAEATGGYITINSKEGEGTTICASFSHEHLDRPPAGDIPGTIVLLIAANPEREISYSYHTDKGEFSISTSEIKEVLGEVPINDPEIIQALRQMIQENSKELY